MSGARTAAVLMFLGGISAVGSSCGSSSGNNGGGASSGLSRSATLASLSTAQAGTLCDWESAKQGGYGRMVNCSDGSQQMSDPDKASCVSGIPTLGSLCPTLTVGDIEDCANAVGTDLCSEPTQAGCAAFNACLGGV
jgi:hypothetical protein